MESLDACVIEAGACVSVLLELLFGSVRDGDVPVRRVLGFLRHGMIVFNEEVTYVVFHRESTFTFGVIPVKADTSKFSAIPISSVVVVFAEDVGEVVCMFASNILNTKIVDD